MAQIGRSLDVLDSKIKQVGADIKAANTDVKNFDKSLKLNPGNVDLVKQKYTALDKSLQLNAQRVSLLKEKQEELNKGLKDGTISQSTYEKELVRLNKTLTTAENGLNQVTDAVRKKNAAIREANYTSLINGLDKAEKKAKTFSKAALAIVGSLTAIVASAVKTGDELDDTAKKYGTTVEKLQIQANRFNLLTDNADTYVEALAKIGTMQTQLARGSGTQYLTFLEQLGLAQEDLQGKSNTEVYDILFNGLRRITDETERAIIAQGLFGEAGLNVALVAGESAAAVAELDGKLLENGIITTNQAAAAAEAADKFDALKQQYQAGAAELMVALMPAIQTLTALIQTTVIPVISNVAAWLDRIGPSGQRILLTLLFLIVVLPKLIAIVKTIITVAKAIRTATLAQAAASATLSAASAPLIPIFIAIGVALLALIAIIALFSKKAQEGANSARSMLNSVQGVDSQLKGMGYNLDYSAEQSYNTNTHREIDINVNVDATGDGTEVNEENAERIAGSIYDQISIDLINQALGAVAR